MALKKGFYKLEDLNSTKMRGTLYRNWLKRFYIQNPKEIRLEDYINKNSCGMEEAFIEEEILKEKTIA